MIYVVLAFVCNVNFLDINFLNNFGIFVFVSISSIIPSSISIPSSVTIGFSCRFQIWIWSIFILSRSIAIR